ncbi:MAG: glucans biosynthesis glucosyltransferase MdoH [Paracoccaceae bacterium]
MPGPLHGRADAPVGVLVLRTVAFVAAVLTGAWAAALFLQYTAANGLTPLALVSSLFLFLSTCWLAWGASLGLIGLKWLPPVVRRHEGPIKGRTVVLVPICNEDPVVTFARVAAIMQSVGEATDATVHYAILSDTRDPNLARNEELWFARLMADTGGEGRLFYRRRTVNTGRKAGNIEDFFARSGGAYDYALILDADSLMEGATLVEMVRRMEAEPGLGLLQTLPVVVRASSVFGRVMQFAAAFFSPVFSRGLSRLQGNTGPFWGHNALVRVKAFAECCGLPVLSGPPPFGGHILSHDYVEAALLARGGWTVRLDTDLKGSYEEGPESVVEHAKRDRRWCQGNLQHVRVLMAPGLRSWSRFVFMQGVFAYVAPVLWALFLISVIADRMTQPPPNYFPDPYQLFPVFPSDETAKAIGLSIGIFGLLIMPKLLTAAEAILTGRSRGFGGTGAALKSVLSDFVLLSLLAPVLMAYQTRSVVQVLMGRDGGWPANRRGGADLSLAEAWEASRFIVFFGVLGLVIAHFLTTHIFWWVLPVVVPMILAPVLIARTSLPALPARPGRVRLFTTPQELDAPPILRLHDQVLARWQGPAPQPDAAPGADAARQPVGV